MHPHTFLANRLKIETRTGAALYGLLTGAILPPYLLMIEPLLYKLLGLEKQPVPAGFDAASTHPHLFILFAILFAPLFETFIFQVAILGGTQLALKNRGIAVIVTTICFSLAHLSEDSSRQAIIALFSGFYFTLVYIQVANISRTSAFTATVICHATHNALVCMLAYYLMWHHPNGVSL